MALTMRWTKRFHRRFALFQSLKHPAPKSGQRNTQRQRHRLGPLAHYARDAAARWYATRIKCAPAARGREQRDVTPAVDSC